MEEERFSVDIGASRGAGGKGVGRSSFGSENWGGVDAAPSGSDGVAPEFAVASSDGRGESSGFAIRSPPKDWDRLRSPPMPGMVKVGGRG